MTVVDADPKPESPQPRQQRRRHLSSAILQVVAMVGIGLLLYPQAADWFATLNHNADISGYVRQVDSAVPEHKQQLLDTAYVYNDELEPGPLTDPYITLSEDINLQSDLYLAYEEMLRLSGTDAIGTLSYPAVGIGLPMFHGTSDEVISRGIGHLYGTSLPVGGPSTHSVLTAHSGLPHAQLFTPLHQSKVGDTFWISVLGEDHYYRVESVEVVEPSETESLTIHEGEDWVTLFTCTPIGVNSHRLLAHAVRIPAPEAAGNEAITGDGLTAGFPWWALWFVAGSGVVGWFLFAPRRKKVRSQTSHALTGEA